MTQSIWPLGDHILQSAHDHPIFQQVAAVLEPLHPLLRSLTYDINDPMPFAVLGLGAEFHLVSIRLLDEETLLIDFPVGELEQTPENLQQLLSDNLKRNWPFRVDSLANGPSKQVVVVIERRLPLEKMAYLAHLILEGWMTKVVDEGLLRFLNGKGENL